VSTDTACCACGARATRSPSPPLPPAVGRAIDRAVDGRPGGPILRSRTGSRMDRHCATRRHRALAKTAEGSTARMQPHMLRHLRHHHARRRSRPTRRPDRRQARRSENHDALRPCPQATRPAPQLHPRCLHGLSNLNSHSELSAQSVRLPSRLRNTSGREQRPGPGRSGGRQRDRGLRRLLLHPGQGRGCATLSRGSPPPAGKSSGHCRSGSRLERDDSHRRLRHPCDP
jgi:hypothetical protein